MRVSVADAKNQLTQLIYAVERGERVTICRHGVPVIDLVKSKEAAVEPRKFGTGRGRGAILDPDWAKPVETPEELDAWLQGKF
jgi:prevent-host-death family protein